MPIRRIANAVLIIALWVASFIGCTDHSKRWINDRNSDYEAPEIHVPSSALSLPILLPLEEIQNAINKKVPTTLVTDQEAKGGLLLTIQRNGALALGGDAHTLHWSVPLKISVRHKISKKASATFYLKPKFASKLTVNEDYSITSESQLTDITWTQQPALKVLGVDLNIAKAAEDMVLKDQQKITDLIDAELSQLNLQKILGRTWDKLSNPIRINKRVQTVYLKIDADSLHLIDHQFHQGILRINLRLKGQLSTLYDSTGTTIHGQQFPPLKLIDTIARPNALYVPLEVSYDRLNELMKQELFGLEFEVEDQHVRLDSAAISSVDSFLLIGAVVSGDIQAEVEILGKPAFDAASKMLHVSSFDFRVHPSSESIVQAGDYLFHDQIVEQVLERLRLPIGGVIDTLPNLIYQGIERGRSGDKINVSSEVDSLAIDQLIVGYNELRLVLFASGSAQVEVEKIKPKALQATSAP